MNTARLHVTSRINWIDWAKVIAIAFVVFGHIPQERGNFLIGYICTFHMPFFFMLSGYLSKGSTDTRANMKKHWHSLIFPYLFYNIIFYPYWIVRYVLNGQGEMSLFEMFVKPFIGTFFLQIETPFSAHLNGVTWFLAVLLTMRIMLNICHRFKHTDRSLLLTAIGMILLNIVATYHQTFESFYMKGLLRCYPFYIFGYFLKKGSLLERYVIKNDTISALSFYMLSISMYLIGVTELLSGYERILLTYLIEISGCLAVIYTCRLFDNYTSDFLVTLSSGTVAIMGLHWICIGIINYLLEHLLGITDICYSWYVAVLLSVAICVLIYPFIVLAKRYFPAVLGKNK
jgi:fucose 4-O-acetylase-like acetyltransferase